MRGLLPVILVSLSVFLFCACKRTPDYVIGEQDMALLMADMHQADAVVELNADRYGSDSLKNQLKQSVFAKHGVTEEQFDTSLMWYGHNLDIYREVYDHVVEILRDREKLIVAEAREAGEKATLMGDSVDIWGSPGSAIFDRRQTGRYAEIQFSLASDDNTRRGDRYEWSFCLYNGKQAGKALLGVDYADGGSEFQVEDVEADKKVQIVLQSDSLKSVSRVFGYMLYEMKEEGAVFADSLMLYRTRLNKERYNRHPYQHKVKD